MAFCIIYVTHKDQEAAEAICNMLIKEKRIACANILPIKAIYWWHGNVENEDEIVSILKTSIKNWDSVRERIEEIHPYEVPCIMKINVEANEQYERWIHESISD
jgi:periplasmic divalent cation tolerance protein